MSDLVGQSLSHYKILEKIGQGGMGVVYKAHDTSLNRKVALKFLPPHLIQDKATRKRFIVEAQAASALDHSNICTVHEIAETPDNELYISMAYYEGQSLYQKLKSGPLSVEETLSIFTQIARGLRAAHEMNIIHRDIKPGNILINDKGVVKIVDFGLAKLAGMELTKTTSSKGTAAYMCPEQVRGHKVDHRCDIWALGIVFYEMLTAHLPFEGEYAEPMMYSIVNTKPKSLSQYLDGVPQSLELIADKLLEKDPVKRYQNLDNLLKDLKEFTPGPEWTVKNSYNKNIFNKFKRIKNNKWAAIAIPSLLIISFIILGFWIFNTQDIKPNPIAIISFENQTGDIQYDYLQKAIPNLLISSLEQSGNLRVTTWEHLNDLLKQKDMYDVKVIDSDLGFELCLMDGIETIVLGTYTKAGDVFALDIKVLDTETKELLSSASSKGNGIGSILTDQIDQLSASIFREFDISDKSQEITLSVSEVTTNSMQAYNYFIRGREEWESHHIESAIQFLEKAIKLDTTFATAYYYLAKAYGWSGIKTSNEMIQKAKEYSHKANNKEKLYIDSKYAQSIEKNNKKRFELLHILTEKFPQEKRAHLELATWYYNDQKLYTEALKRYNTIIEIDPNYGLVYNRQGLTYMAMGEFSKALESFKRYASLNPGDGNTFDSMGELYLRMGDLDKALAKYMEAIEVQPGFFFPYRSVAYIYALKEDYDNTMKWIDKYISIAPSEEIRARGYMYKGFYYFWQGQIKLSLEQFQLASNLYKASENIYELIYLDWAKCWIYLTIRDIPKGKDFFNKWYKARLINFPQYNGFTKAQSCLYFGITDLQDNNLESAKHRLREMKSSISNISSSSKDRLKRYYDIFNIEVVFAQDSMEKALRIKDKLTPLKKMSQVRPLNLITYNLPFPVLRNFLARAYQQRGYMKKAIAEYEKLITFNPKSVERRLVYPIYYFRLAHLYERSNQIEKAVENYQKFLRIWKKADKELPEVIEAKVNLKKLLVSQ